MLDIWKSFLGNSNSMQFNPSIFYGEGVVTSIDYAYIDNTGDIIGGSFAPAFQLMGNIENTEQVIVDFSKGKKLLKEIIDDKEDGIDHKLIIFGDSKILSILPDSDRVVIHTDKWVIDVPRNAVHVMSVYQHNFYHGIREYVNSKLSGIEVFVADSPSKFATLPYSATPAQFRYTHGLKCSSSWGCQNIAHGHLSYISIGAENTAAADSLAIKLAAQSDRTMFVNQENFSQEVGHDVITYTTDRGMFKLTRNADTKLCICKKETTIENLVSMIAESYYDELKSVGAFELQISEGLQKGAVVQL